MDRKIPPIGTRGIYSLNAPWATDATVLYSCAALREFVDLENLGSNVYETYYLPYDLERSIYERDRRNNAVIVTLVSETEAPIYVPSSYIASFPDLSYRNYQHLVLSASLGPLPDYIDLTFVKDQMAATLSEVIGVTPVVHVSVAAMNGVISPEDHDVLEVARAAAIANRTTDHARVLQLQQQNTALAQRLAILEQILKDHNLIPA